MIIAADVDGTITTGEMGRGVGRYLATQGRNNDFRRFYGAQLPRYIASKIGLMNPRQFKIQWAMKMPQLFAGMSIQEIEQLFAYVVENELWPHRRHNVIAELQKFPQVVLVSGSYQKLIDPLAQRIGASALGSELEVVNGRLTGQIAGMLNIGEQKVARLQAWLGDNTLHAAYGDAIDDVPMLELSQNPVAVYPDQKLRAVAEARGWRIMDD